MTRLAFRLTVPLSLPRRPLARTRASTRTSMSTDLIGPIRTEVARIHAVGRPHQGNRISNAETITVLGEDYIVYRRWSGMIDEVLAYLCVNVSSAPTCGFLFSIGFDGAILLDLSFLSSEQCAEILRGFGWN